MHGIIHGSNAPDHCSHFIDCTFNIIGIALERFKKDHAVHDKMSRNQERYRKNHQIEERRKLQLDRENHFQLNTLVRDQNEEDKFQKSRHLYEMGLKKTAHSPGLPFNPITLQYHNTTGGINQY